MGACSIEMVLDGKTTHDGIRKAFKARQESDRYENGNRGYTGDFQTVHDVRIEEKTFNSANDAMEYCLDRAEKWSYVVAVRYKCLGKDAVKLPKSVQNLAARIDGLRGELAKRRKAMGDAATAAIAKATTVTCTHCRAKLPTKFTSVRGADCDLHTTCPVCDATLAPKGLRRAYNLMRERIELLEGKHAALVGEAKRKAAEKSTNTKWMIAGWGAE